MAQTPGNNNSFQLTEMQLTPWKEYTYCITANTIHPKRAGPTVKQNQLWNFMVCMRTKVHSYIVYVSLYFATKWGVLTSLPYIIILPPIQWNPLLRTAKKSCLIRTFGHVLKCITLFYPQNKDSLIAIARKVYFASQE